ncbi:hypothetical protein [Humibacter ginsenosidimutans]|uniref:Uncharacterized protein n=1 Tax=Humibacter ginsenosidimutans TaxID=2599293 RepID=A0A5B8M3M9_9MICO|nr:hypothetical protein [Humibacter ginsenosidimutans]QDZ14385.1 hypothetical protein FPZ11_06065 [Humibacter ginsenosidimutans]
MHRASIADEDVTEVHGLLVTSPARTIADLARAGISRECVVALDYTLSSRAPQGLRLVKEELIELVVRQGGWGRRRAVELIEFGDGRSGSPGETGSRLIFAEGGFESPELQHHYPRHGRRGYDSDFWWKRSLRGRPLAGEFDGAGKYLRKEYLRNKTPGEAVVAEKRREDYMRRCDGSDFMRWGFPEVMRPPLLRALAIQHGVPRIRRN